LQDIVLYVLGNGLLPVDASGVYFVLTASDVTVGDLRQQQADV
jgi:hypothetical protein